MKFKNGDRVVVHNSKLLTHGCTGTIEDYGFQSWKTSVNVRLDDGKLLTYKYTNLSLIKKEEEISKMYITGDFKVAKVKFISGTNTNTEYEYAMFEEYQVGDTVVVASAHHGLGLAKITEIITKDEAKTKKFEREIVCYVCMDIYEQRKKNRARLQELNSQMEKRAQELNKLAIFEMLAEKDESLKDMLDEYKTLTLIG